MQQGTAAAATRLRSDLIEFEMQRFSSLLLSSHANPKPRGIKQYGTLLKATSPRALRHPPGAMCVIVPWKTWLMWVSKWSIFRLKPKSPTLPTTPRPSALPVASITLRALLQRQHT